MKRALRPQPRLPNRSRAFTTIELLIVIVIFAAVFKLAGCDRLFKMAPPSRYLEVASSADNLLSHIRNANRASAVWSDEPVDPDAKPLAYAYGDGKEFLIRPLNRKGRPVGIVFLDLQYTGPPFSFMRNVFHISFDTDSKILVVDRRAFN